MSLRENVALVTGGSRGIGRAVCLELARQGAAVAVNYAGGRDAAEETVRLGADFMDAYEDPLIHRQNEQI